jgi:hypothetical protein
MKQITLIFSEKDFEDLENYFDWDMNVSSCIKIFLLQTIEDNRSYLEACKFYSIKKPKQNARPSA